MCCYATDHVQPVDPKNNNIQHMSLADWMDSKLMRQVRIDMMGEQPLKQCVACYRDEAAGGESYRITHNWRSMIFTRQAFDASFEQSPHHDLFTSTAKTGASRRLPVDLHIDMGNECNLACKYCSPGFSTTIGSKYRKWGIIPPDQPLHQSWMKNEAAWQKFLNELLQSVHLKSVHFMGGEPTMNPRLEEFFDFFIEHGKTNFAVSFVTNATKFHPRLIDKIKQFERADIDISVDSILDNQRYIRQGIDLEQFRQNMADYLAAQSDRFHVCLKPAVSVLTASTFPDLIEYLLDHNIMMESNTVYHPAHLQISVLPWEIRQQYLKNYKRVADKIRRHIEPGEVIKNRSLQSNAANLLSELEAVQYQLELPEPKNIKKIRTELAWWLSKWDKEYSLDVGDYYPEWKDFLIEYGYKKFSNQN